jgi:ankyrin repeat protein
MGLLNKLKTLVTKEAPPAEALQENDGDLSPAALDDPPYTFRAAVTAIRRGQVDQLRAHLNHNPRFALCIDWDGNTLLHQAAHFSCPKALKLLLQAGADVGVNWFYQEKTPLHFAICTDELWVTANKRDSDFNTHRQNQYATVEMLLHHKADINLADANGEPPLHTAVRMGYADIAQLLLNHGAAVDMLTLKGSREDQHSEGRTPLLLAARYSKNKDVIEFLLRKGANPNTQDNDPGFSALHYIAASPSHEAEAELGQIAEILLQHKAEPNLRTLKKGAQTPLHLAAAYNHIAVAEALLKYGADINAKGAKDMAPMGIAASAGSVDMVECLLRYGVDVYASRALFYAAYCKESTAVMELLLERGVDINRPDEHGITPIFAAISLNSFRNVKFLLDHKADTSIHPPSRTVVQHAFANWGAVEAMPEDQRQKHAEDARKIVEILGGFD